MCGIAGIYRPGGRVSRDELEAMTRALSHRGPDASAIWCDGPIGLAHTRLKIVDLSERGAQPMASSSGQSRIVFNGEIYNHKRLRPRLERIGLVSRSTSDTEVLIEGLERLGEGFLDEIEGMFAFALFDQRSQRLLLVRDRAGEKPLFYMPLARGGVAFASEIKALRAVPALGVTRDVTAIPSLLLHGYPAPPRTMYEGVLQLAPASLVRFGEGAPEAPRRYWRVSFDRSPRAMSEGEAREELRARMRQIVADRLEADVPVGAFLSGGLDSATVVGVATRDLCKTVHTYSIGFPDPAMDESADARLSAAHLGSVHEEFMVTEADIPPIELLVHHHDGPFGDSSAIPTYLVSKMARQRVTVAVTGDGGDELFGGYPRFIAGQLGELMPRWAGTLGHGLSHAAGAAQRLYKGETAATTRSPFARAERFARAIEKPLEHRLLQWTSVFSPEAVPTMLRPSLRPHAEALTAYSDRVFSESIGQSALARILHHNFSTYLPEDLLVKVDRCAMAVSLETRSPLLDAGLISFVGGLPDHMKVRGFTTKRLLRETFSDLLAPELLKRPKRGFGVPLARWLDSGPLAAQMQADLRDDGAEIYRHVDHHAVQTRVLGAPLDAARALQAFTLWTLAVWLRQG